LIRKVFLKKVDDVIVTLAFTRPSETSRARKVSEVQSNLEKSNRALRRLELKKKDYVHRVDNQIEDIKNEIKEYEAYLQILHSDEFQNWLDEQRQDEVEAYARAEDLMRQYLGLEAYATLMEKGELVFEVEEKTFKITRYGLVYEKQDEEFQPRCVLRPKELPIPDHIVSVLTTLKENPNLWRR